MSPREMLDYIETADRQMPRGRRRIILEMRHPRLLDFDGRYLGHDDEGPVYGFTRRQALDVRDRISDAARHDFGLLEQ